MALRERPNEVARPPRAARITSRRAVLFTGVAALLAAAGLEPDRAVSTGTAATLFPVLGSGEFAGSLLLRQLSASRSRDSQPAHSAGPAHEAGLQRPAVSRRRRPIRSIDDLGRRAQPLFGPHAFMLTLDDGPHPSWTPRLLALLEQHHVVATFFMIGSQVSRYPGVVREVAARGHAIGNHTWSHDLQLATRPVRQIRGEIDRTSHAIHAACGVVPSQFRAPGGNWGPALLDVLAEQRLQPVGWNVDPMDWSRPGVAAIDRTLLRARPHDIALCHDGGGDRSQTLSALARTIPQWQRRGYRFATLPGQV